jgi:micrococcal nuclease
MYRNRIKINEKVIGVGLIVIGLAGLLAGFRFSPEETRSPTPIQAVSARTVSSSPSATQGFADSDAKTGHQQVHVADAELQNGRQPCRVLMVYDGDTIGCDLDGDGRIERPYEEIRLLGMDTPERSYSRKNQTYGTERPTDEPYAKESSEWMEHQVTHKTVYLAYDLRKRDRYGRTLAFVYLSPTAQESLNLQGVRQGYAKMLFIGKNRRFEDEFIQAEASAQKARRGLWGVSGASGL